MPRPNLRDQQPSQVLYQNNFPSISATGDPTKGEKSELVFYDENEIKIDIFSVAYTPEELILIAESLFN